MRAAGKAAAQVLEMIARHVTVGITTEKLDRICEDYIVEELKLHPGTEKLPRLSQIHLHLAEPSGLSRHPRRTRT